MSLNDHDRPLNKRGKRDAPLMAQVLQARGVLPELLLSSTAVRAHITAKVFQEQLASPTLNLQLDERLYHAYPQEIEAVVRELPEDVNTIALFAHNPGLTMLANQMQGNPIDNVPTTGIVVSSCAVENWKDWTLEKCQQTAFWYPKQFV